MKTCDLFKLALAAMLLTGMGSALGQQAASPADSSASTAKSGSKGGKGGAAAGDAKAGSDSAAAETCVVHPGDSSAGGDGSEGSSKSKSASGKSGADSGGAGAVTVNQYAAAGAAGANDKKKSGGGGTPAALTFLPINLQQTGTHAAGTNATEIAPKLSALSTAVVSAEAVSPSQIEVTLDSTKVSGKDASGRPKLDVLTDNLTKYANALAKGTPEIFSLTLPSGTGKACDVAHALVNAIPGIKEITAVDDSRLFVTAIAGFQSRDTVEKAAKELASPLTASSFHVESHTQRLYYNHDPASVALLINNAFPNVSAQALLPDLVVLSDAVDGDEGNAYKAVKAAERAIAQLDQPHPQVQVDAWSLQLSTMETKSDRTLDDRVHELEDMTGQYDEVLNGSLKRGWSVLARELNDPTSLDRLLREYITSTTHICRTQNGASLVQRWERPYEGESCVGATDPADAEAGKTPGYGLGYTTLYYPLTPNLIDMLMTLISLNHPRAATEEILDAMERGHSSHGDTAMDDGSVDPCRKRDEDGYGNKSPDALQMECVYDALMRGLLARQSTGSPTGTSGLGQMRAALVDFLYHYKALVRYPDDFQEYLEPLAADTLDSSLSPIVDAFSEDLSVFQDQMQKEVHDKLQKDKKLSYGYGGVVSVKVLGEVQAQVDTATQNFFDATPPVTLNDVLSSLQAEGASAKKSPLTSLETSFAPAKALELMTALGQAFSPKPTTAEIGRGLSLTVTAHTLSGAYGAELDLKVQSTENGAKLSQLGSTSKTDDLNSRVSQHTVDTKVRVDSLKLFKVSTLGSTLARGRQPWELLDPVRIPLLGPLVKVPRAPTEVYSQSMVFVDTFVVPTAADLGFGVPVNADLIECAPAVGAPATNETKVRKKLSEYDCEASESRDGNTESTTKPYVRTFKQIHKLSELPDRLGMRIEQYHDKIVACLNREYIADDGTIHVSRGYLNNTKKTSDAEGKDPCYSDFPLSHYDAVD